MAANPSAIANLLRLARTECRAAVAFAVLATNGGQPEMLRIPPTEATGTPSDQALAEIVERAALDPEFGRARAFVRTVQLPSATLLAVAPVSGAARPAMVGVLGEDSSGFGPAQLDLLDRLAERIARHVKALQTFDRPELAESPTTEAASDPEAPGPAGEQAAAPARSAAAVTTTSAPLPFAGFGDEPSGVIAPSEAPCSEAEAPPRQPLGAQTSSIGGFLRPTWPYEPPPSDETARRSPATSLAGRLGGSQPQSPGPEPPAPGSWWVATDALTGLASLGQFFSRAGRLLGSEARAAGAVALVLVEVPDERTAPAAGRALAAQLRFSDPLARVDRDLFAAAVLLFPGSMRGDAVEERLGSAVRAALEWLAPVRTTHVLAEPGDRRDVDELLRQAMAGLPGRALSNSSR